MSNQTNNLTHTGWHIHDDQAVYLHDGGAIGAAGPIAGVETRLGPVLHLFALPNPPECDELRDAVHASLAMLGVASAPVSVALLAMAYRAPLGEIDFSGFLVGPTGAGKSELAALVQQHYGAVMDREDLPANWSWTTNALRFVAHHAKDAVLVIDDLWPTSGRGVRRLHRDAGLLLSGQDPSAAVRRKQGRPPMPPRALILTTGENLPRVESLGARVLALEVGSQDVSWDNLTMLQKQAWAGKFAAAMAGYLRWLAPTHGQEAERVRTRVQELRQEAVRAGVVHRTAHMISSLAIGLERFLQFAEHVGVVDIAYRQEVWRRAWSALVELGEAQASHWTDGRSGEPAA